ncbi:MAG: hypothetical protein ACT4QB_00420 [Gammaproteobacteria bacterium]
MNQRDKNPIRPAALPGLPPSASIGSALRAGRSVSAWLLAWLLWGLAS